MPDRPPPRSDDAQDDLVLRRILEAADLPTTGRFQRRAGWVSRAWIGDEHVVRLTTDARFRDAYAHEAEVVALLEGIAVPHARHIAHGDGPDGPWSISERLPGQTLHEAWSTADPSARQSMIESLGAALRALHRVPAPEGLMPPWLSRALGGGAWPAYHPPVIGRIHDRLEAAMLSDRHDRLFIVDLGAWIDERLPLVAADQHVLVHGDLHGSNVMVAEGRVTGLIDFAEALTQPADVELDALLRWCARPGEFAPTPGANGLDPASLAQVPSWLRRAYPELFGGERLSARLELHDMTVELAICAHHPDQGSRDEAARRIGALLEGRSHLRELTW